MAEEDELPITDHYTNLSQGESYEPLSPVLGTGKSVRKLFKNKKRHKRGPSKIVQKLENTLKPSCESVVEHENSCLDDSSPKDFQILEDRITNIESIPGPSDLRPAKLGDDSKQESFLEHIKNLEAMDAKTTSIIKSISLTTATLIETENSQRKIIEDKVSIEPLKNKNDGLSRSCDITKESCVGCLIDSAFFQTGTGKNINISDINLDKSKKLFQDILHPLTSQISRKKKYSYLHKNFNLKGDKDEVSFSNKKNDKYLDFREKSMVLDEESRNQIMCKNMYQENTKEKKSDNVIDILKANDLNSFSFDHCSISKRRNVNDLFGGENFDDLNLNENLCFKPASLSLGQVLVKISDKNINCQSQAVENLFENKKHDIHLNEFKLASMNQNKTAEKQISGSNISNCNLLNTKSKLLNIFKDENFDDLILDQNNGFRPASLSLRNVLVVEHEQTGSELKSISSKIKSEADECDSTCLNDKNVKEEPITKDKSTYPTRNIYEIENFDDLNLNVSKIKPVRTNCGIVQTNTSLKNKNDNTKDFKRLELPEPNAIQSKKSFRDIFTGENFDDLNLNFGSPRRALNKSKFCAVSNSKEPKNIFEGENFDDLNLAGLVPKFKGFMPSKSNMLQAKRPDSFQSPFRTPAKNTAQDNNGTNLQNDGFNGFSCEEQQVSLNISKAHCKIYNIIFARFQSIVSSHNSDVPLFKLSELAKVSKTIQENKQKCSLKYETNIVNRKRKFSEVDSDHNSVCQNLSSSVTPLQGSSRKKSKKRLGCPFSPTIQVSETVLKRAKLMFEDLESKPVETSTPVKFGGNLAQPLVCNLTPIQTVKKNLGSSFLNASESNSNISRSFYRSSNLDSTITNTNRFSLNKPSQVDIKIWLENLNHERHMLEEQLRIVDEKQTILTNQKTILDYRGKGSKRVMAGVLYKSKTTQHRVPFQEYVHNSSSVHNADAQSFLNQINPQNAHLLHFYINDKRKTHIKTEDGAIIVPNIDSRIGISEIEHSFKLLDGVDLSLIPKGWTRNHYKWIVWKLASYERMYADKFEECLSVENIVQQLKYRYDVEIDNVKRSALRKIFEKDDCSQRRMVLCVSKIMKVNNSYELELTDGWYSIRTVIDLALCDQITKGKIKHGVKLMVYGAELMNCEGCHPLEATDLMYLKISYNSTRRCLWWCKMGFQKEAGPFSIPISSINMDGGKIGCIRCFISRVYPVKYMEKCGDKNVWRNRKAEERREQEYYNENFNRSDNNERNGCNNNSVERKSYKDVKNINDPYVLYDMLQRSEDPEGLQELLSSSQKSILYNYSMNKSTMVQYANKGKCLQKRAVTSVLKIKIVDAAYDSDKLYDFQIWQPGEGHLQELKEGEVVTIFHVSCSSKWGLSANKTTRFQRETKPIDERFQKFRRKVTQIGELQSFFKQDHLSNEFDTVGLVIKKLIGDKQEIWMASRCQKLLVVRILDSPKNILALDTVNEGQVVSVCNLMIKQSFDTHSVAVADHSVIFARYSQHKRLQEVLETLEEDLENVDKESFIQICKNRIMQIDARFQTKSPSVHLDMDGMECSQITITDIALLECVERLG